MKVMTIETQTGTIVCSLVDDATGNVGDTIAHFERKANSGFYNGLKFHRVEDWVIQGGDPSGTGSGGGKMPAQYNKLPFKRGALGVARGGNKRENSDCQFFIVKNDAHFLDGEYTNIGQVIKGMDTVNRIVKGIQMLKVSVGEQGHQTVTPISSVGNAEGGSSVFCSNCGTRLADGSRFCNACGKAQGAEASPNSLPFQYETCQIKTVVSKKPVFFMTGIGEKNRLVVEAVGPSGRYIVAESPEYDPYQNRPFLQAIVDSVISDLTADGWESTFKGNNWYDYRFRRVVR